MTPKELSAVMDRLEKYYRNYYAGTDKKEVFAAWFEMFKDDDPAEVNRAVVAYICTNTFPPTVAGIKTLMAENRMAGQMTEMQAWQKIRDAVDFSTNRDEARKQYDQLSPLLKKLAGSPSQLISWRKVNEDTFEGVIASNVQRSYRELARREAVFYAIPGQLQAEQTWRVEGPKEQAALPEAEKPKKLAYEKPEWMIRREEMSNGEEFRPNLTVGRRPSEFDGRTQTVPDTSDTWGEKMNVIVTDNPKACGYDAVRDEATIHREDADWMKELAGNIRRTKDKAIIRQAEREFHDEMFNKYGKTVAGELLMKLWQATKEMNK